MSAQGQATRVLRASRRPGCRKDNRVRCPERAKQNGIAAFTLCRPFRAVRFNGFHTQGGAPRLRRSALPWAFVYGPFGAQDDALKWFAADYLGLGLAMPDSVSMRSL
jgi:hypothetical protein